ncbi:hypothetical protein ONS95_004222 [Cadophora gregata]|uniref:uncharacterized protein n=1 Tax=Cadophora gregata TaxID=51156 RepID=UPI0026DD6DB6|nr:uncharacterized protein ONS95_004222 [Cadophora gregata]KAK0105405.1 hypothetical protein ONS96_004796 [Cadophora gregata f. sp. sojae]KAK0105695.1 hypothetical protein ONS95_004222 [Cadophora gregata]
MSTPDEGKVRTKGSPLSFVPRNIEPFKEEILELAQKAKTGYFIAKHLKEKYDFTVSPQTIGRRLENWGHVEAKKENGLTGFKKDLDPWKKEICAWVDIGLSTKDILSKLVLECNIRTKKVTIEKAISRWNEESESRITSWRTMRSVRSTRILEQPSAAVNLLLPAELAALKEAIVGEYASVPLHLPDPTFDWIDRLTDAACYDETIQVICIKEWKQPGHHWSNEREFDPTWVLGIHLPGSYQFSKVNTEAKILNFVTAQTPKILTRVKDKLMGYLKVAIAGTTTEYGEEYVREAGEKWPTTTPPLCLTKTVQAVRQEVFELQRDMGLSKSLDRLLAQLPASLRCRNLHSHYSEPQPSLLLHRFSNEATQSLKKWQKTWMVMDPLAPLTQEDFRLVEQGPAASNVAEKPGPAEDAEEHEEAVPSSETDEFGGGIDVDEIIGDGGHGWDEDGQDEKGEEEDEIGRDGAWKRARYRVLLLDRVLKYVPQPMIFTDWRPPTTGALLGSSPSRFGFEPWTPNPEKATGAQLDQYMDTTCAYLNKITTLRTPEEEEHYDSICRTMMACTSRPLNISKRVTVTTAPIGWSRETGHDSWFHCRRLLQMLAQKSKLLAEDHQSFEIRLMLLLAAIEGGSTEALLWLVPLEGLLQEISIHIIQLGPLSSAEETCRRDLCRELMTFVHAVTLNSLSLRCYFGQDRDNTNIQAWYDTVTKCEPRCFTRWCQQPPPAPRLITNSRISRDVFAVGCNDTRLGDSKVSLFISSNRRPIHPCLICWFRMYIPDPTLICAFMWFGGIHHVYSACTSGSGRHKERDN